MTFLRNRLIHKWSRQILKPVVKGLLPMAERLAGFQTNGGEYLPYRIGMLLGSYEAEERRLMGRFLRRGQTVVDVGANVGYLTRFFARATSEIGKIYAFEPNPMVFPLLKRNTASFPQVCALNVGLSFDDKEAELFLPGSNYSVGSFCPGYPALHVVSRESNTLHSVRAQLRNGDACLAEQGVDKIDILKIDVEGWELNVLRGLEKTILRSPSIAIFCEFNRAAQECAGHAPKELLAWFLDRGFKIAAPHNHVLKELTPGNTSEWIERMAAPCFSTVFALREQSYA